MIKKIKALLTLFVIALALLELCSFLAFPYLTGKPFDLQALREARESRRDFLREKLGSYAEEDARLYYLHPYLGYNGRPGRNSFGQVFNEYGFLGEDPPFPYKKKEDDFVVAVLGGSVAANFAVSGKPYLEKRLKRLAPELSNKRLVLVNLANGGFKQPQQLMALIYAFFLGSEFDFVLNLDGFNDVALAVENLNFNIHPLYPSGLHMGFTSKGADKLDANTVDSLYTLRRVLKNENKLLKALNKSPWKYSVFLNALTTIWTERSKKKIELLNLTLARQAQDSVLPDFQGPKLDPSTTLYFLVIDAWLTGSEMIYALSRSKGLPYAHVLQPNQYHKGSKPLSANELKIAYTPDISWSRAARETYPLLVEQGKEMVKHNFPFYDAAMAFKSAKEDLYVDTCCHFNERGNELLSDYVAKAIATEMKKKTP